MKAYLPFDRADESWSHLCRAYVAHLRQGRAGCVSEDRPWYDDQIRRAERLEPDRYDLGQYLLTLAIRDAEHYYDICHPQHPRHIPHP